MGGSASARTTLHLTRYTSMAFGKLLRRLLFGATESEEKEIDRSATIEYRGYRITPVLRRESGQFLTCALIEKDFPDGPRRHELIRADTHMSAEDAKSLAILKARRLIDEQGDRLFG